MTVHYTGIPGTGTVNTNGPVTVFDKVTITDRLAGVLFPLHGWARGSDRYSGQD